jgi:hypothetical protein
VETSEVNLWNSSEVIEKRERDVDHRRDGKIASFNPGTGIFQL